MRHSLIYSVMKPLKSNKHQLVVQRWEPESGCKGGVSHTVQQSLEYFPVCSIVQGFSVSSLQQNMGSIEHLAKEPNQGLGLRQFDP